MEVNRVTKVTKGGNNMSFRATVVVGDGKGKVGVGCAKAIEVQTAVTKAAADARKCMVSVPISKGDSFPHRVTVKGSGGAVVMLRPAGPGTGVIDGHTGCVRTPPTTASLPSPRPSRPSRWMRRREVAMVELKSDELAAAAVKFWEQLVATCKHLYDKIADTQIAFFLTALVGFIGQAHVRNCV